MKRAALCVVLAGCGGGEVDVGARSPAPVPAPSAASPAACTRAHATTARVGVRCALLACDEGFADCDGNVETGCEIDLRTSVASCGACDHACVTCDRGACGALALVSSDAHARELVGAEARLAWLDEGRLRVHDGEGTATWTTGLASSPTENEAGALALGPGFALVADLAGERLLRVDPASRATLASGRFASVVLVGGVAYALRLAGTTPGAIVRLPLDGGAPSELVTGLAVTHACRIAADETRVWWTDPDAEIVWRAPLAGGAAEPWATRQRLACGVVVDANRAHWIAVDPTLAVFVVSVAKETTPDPDWIRSAFFVGHYAPQKTAWDVTRSPSAVFFASAHDGAVVRVADTGESSLVAGAQRIRGVAFAGGPAWATPEGVLQLALSPGAGP